MLLWWGPEFVQLYNDAYEPVLGAKHPRAMGQPVSECWSEVWHVIGPMIEQPFRGGPASTSDDLFVAIRRKGFLEEAHFRVAYSPVLDDSVPSGIGGVLATVTETTEQVFAERQLRTLRELGTRGAQDVTTAARACETAAVALADDRWDVPFALFFLLEDAAPRLVASVGIAAANVEPEDWPVARVAARRTIEELELAHCRTKLPATDWRERPSHAIALPLAAPDQPRAYGVVICGLSPHRALDASYRSFFELVAGQVTTAVRNARALEEERRRAEALAELDRAKTAFFSNVSHELRTPLTLMLGPTEDALGEPGGALRGEALETVYRSELRLLKLVNALLDFSRIEAGRIQASYVPSDLAERTRELASVFRSAIERAGLSYRVRCDAIDQPVYVDLGMWETIVLNLLSNALKFTFAGEIELRLCDRGDDVALIVRDTGTGIPAAELPRLFERFHRVEGAAARTHEGSGIGLALVNDLVKLHGGSIEVASEPGAGTTFTVAIPKGSTHLDPRRIGSAAAQPAALGQAFVQEALRWLPDADRPAEPNDPDRPRVLVADDNADMRDYVVRLLAPSCRVEAVGDGETALARALADPPELVLTDVMMPKLDGFGLLAALRRHPETRELPVVMLSARAGEEARVEGLQAGADDYLIKPFSARELRARVRSQLELSRVRRQAQRERERAAQRVSRLHAVTTAFSAAAEPDQIAEIAVALGLDALEASCGAFWRIDGDRLELVAS
ncbi:MAG TPA: ATP-binding protein, partial [Kofleriaceae bacterium]|nr:ATP-binding protein [Kofleriaceae bacterium]